MKDKTIKDWIVGECSKYETQKARLGDNWEWNMRDHVQLILHLKNGVFYTGENNWLRAFKQVMEPMLQLSYWTEDIEVKDIIFFIENKNGKVLSFLVKKYHDEVYTRENDIDTLIDKITESDIDYGGVVVQKGVKTPEVVPLESIAFCDQTDVLGGPIGFKYFFSPDKIRSMSKFGWGKESNGATISLEELCELASETKEIAGQKNANQVTGKVIEVYIIRGNLPESWLYEDGDPDYECNQLRVEALYTDEENNKQSVTLYRKKEEEGNLLFFTSKEVYQRALGRGVGETLIHPQIWTNFLTIHKTNMIEAASKVPLYTDDESYSTKNKIQDMESLELTTIQDGKKIYQVPTAAPANIALFTNEINMWYEQAQSSASAYDPIMGKEGVSGTTFRGQERLVAQGKGGHDRRRGKRAKFIELIYRKIIIPDIKKEILKGKKFLATLTTDELRWVAEQMATVKTNDRIKELMFKELMRQGKTVNKEQQDMMLQMHKDAIIKGGTQQLIEILKDEFEDIEIKIGINVAGKQKDLAVLSDKLLSIFQFIFANPQAFQQAMQIPALAKGFENILEYGGMNVSDFSSLLEAPVISPLQQQDVQKPPKLSLNQPQA